MLTIYVCIGSACHLKGSYEVIEKFQELIKKNNLEESVSIHAAFCLGHCTEAVSVKIEDRLYSVQPKTVENFFESEVIRRIEPCK